MKVFGKLFKGVQKKESQRPLRDAENLTLENIGKVTEEKKGGMIRAITEMMKRHFFLAIFSLVISISLFYTLFVYKIGNLSYTYSDQRYSYMETVLDAYIKQNLPVRVIDLQRAVDKCSSDYENGETVLKCVMKNGFFLFDAELTATLSDSLEIKQTERNYNSREEYMTMYWICMGGGFIGGGVISWFITWSIITLIHYIINFFKEKKKSKNEEEQNMGHVTEVINNTTVSDDTLVLGDAEVLDEDEMVSDDSGVIGSLISETDVKDMMDIMFKSEDTEAS